MQNKKYDIVFVLNPSPLNSEGVFDEFDEDKKQKGKMLYLGGQVRMQAAVDFALQVKRFVVVGGKGKTYDTLTKKVDDMKKFLTHNSVEPQKIIRITSEADTTGNFRAIHKCLKDKSWFSEAKKIGILTNFYHLPRALRFAADIFPNKVFTPLAAEAIIQRYHPSYSFYPNEFLFRVFQDINGLRDWENGTYDHQFKNPKKWFGEVHEEDKKLLN